MMSFRKKLDCLTNQFHINYNDFEQKINETKEEITNLQTELETTGDEVKTNTAEKIRIAESISSVKSDLKRVRWMPFKTFLELKITRY